MRSLEPARPFSAGIYKFHQLCSVFCDIAAAYIHVKKQRSEQQNAISNVTLDTSSAQNVLQQEGMTVADFGQYLSSLGLMVQPADNNTNFSNSIWTNTGSLQD